MPRSVDDRRQFNRRLAIPIILAQYVRPAKYTLVKRITKG